MTKAQKSLEYALGCVNEALSVFDSDLIISHESIYYSLMKAERKLQNRLTVLRSESSSSAEQS
jgi:hypothetical protein